MSHKIEFVNGEASMAYAGAVPWHNLGTQVESNLSPSEMLKAAKLNWKVLKVPAFIELNGEKLSIGHDALVRSTDNRIFDIVTNEWHTVQNKDAFEFFTEFCDEGKMSMETAGSLKGGQIVWGLAKINESFELFKKDKIDSYLLFSNHHRYGWSTSVSWSAIRVVCWNTFVASLSATKDEQIVKVSHRREFVAEKVKEALGISKEKLAKYKETAEFLSSKKAPKENIVEYFKKIFPVLTQKDNSRKELSKAAKLCVGVLDTQPGAELGAGSWWQAYNTISFYTDHLAGRNANNRLTSAWYGQNRNVKNKALKTAVEMASVA